MSAKAFSFQSLVTPTKARIILTDAQISLILGLETILQDLRYHLICPVCVGTSNCDGWVSTQNAPHDLLWKLTCDCTERVAYPSQAHSMEVGGYLVTLADTLLGPAKLEIRCPRRIPAPCRDQPIHIQQTATAIRVRCECSRYSFTERKPSKPS